MNTQDYQKKLDKLEELRILWKFASGIDRKIIENRAKLLKWSLKIK